MQELEPIYHDDYTANLMIDRRSINRFLIWLKDYFRNIPDFEYVNRTKDGQFISNYTQVKNFFKRGKVKGRYIPRSNRL